MKYYSIKVNGITFKNVWAENVKEAKRFIKYRMPCGLSEGCKIKDMQFVKSYNEPIDE